ncbi:MAG: hypothetical protein ABEK04_02390 [Candidatus Nanohalobium sp.]
MAEESAIPDRQDLINAAIASAVIGAAFTAFRGRFTFEALSFYVVVGLILVVLREGGQRTVAHWMDSYVDLEISREGALTTLLAAFFSVVSDFNILLLFPVFSEFSGESYEQWGKGVDAMWMKRQYWLSSAGIIGLWLGWGAAYLLSMGRITEVVSLFTIFQLMPFDYKNIPTGPLDGATILRWSGFAWLLMMGTSIIMLLLSI